MINNVKQREKKIDFVQQQLSLLQAYGEYGYEVLEALRERIKSVSVAIEEDWREDAFIFTYSSQTVCRYHWQDEDTVQIVLYDKVRDKVLQFAHECKKGKKIEWPYITSSIGSYIRDLQALVQ